MSMPITAAKPQNTFKAVKKGSGTAQAQSMVKAPPAPFQNKQGTLKTVPTDGSSLGSVTQKNIGDGKSKNTSGMAGKHFGMAGGIKGSMHSATGSPFPKKRFPQSGMKKFYGG